MGIRTVNGNTFTEDGWPLVDQAGCTWVHIPGCNPPVTIQAQTGIPATLFTMWIADLNAFVEHVRDGDTASWTESNSVLGQPGRNNGSNHLGGTAIDVDWDDHPMGPAYAGYSQEQIDEIRRMREYYKLPDGTYLIWWAEDWDTPKDSMHFQMGYDTYDKQDAINEWIATHQRVDGFSTYRRGELAHLPAAATVLAAATGLSMDRVNAILPTLQQGLRLANCDNVNRIAMFIAQTREESANYSTTVEFGDLTGEPFYPYIGRTWIQITWQSNYADFGQWCVDNGLISDPNQFVNDPESLGDMRWAGIGAAWYWTVQRPHINEMCDNGDIVGVTKAINGGTRGLDVRTAYWNQALAQGNNLLALIDTGDDMSAEAEQMIREMHDEMFKKGPSRAAVADNGDNIETLLGYVYNIDGNVWDARVMGLPYLLDVPYAVQHVEAIAKGGPVPESWAASNEFVTEFAQEFCKALVAFKPKWQALFGNPKVKAAKK